MASASGIRAGRAFIELYANDAKLVQGLKSAQRRLQAFGSAVTQIGSGLQSFGTKLLGLSAALAAPLAGGVKAFADVEQELANLKAAANPTAAEFDKIKTAVNQISQATGVAPAEVATVFTELLKAGMNLQTVLGGAAEAALKFARVGGLEVAQAATVMNDAMNAFAKQGLSAAQVVDIFSKAADASSISIQQISESFAMSAAVYGAAGQSLQDLTTAIALLGNAGLKGSDAGTSLKTMLMSLMAPSDTGAKAMAALGISVRDAAGNLFLLPQLIAAVASKLQGLDGAARDRALRDIFGTDAIRAAIILLNQGTKGWDEFTAKLGGSLSVAQKFAIMTATLKGIFNALLASLQRIGAAIGEAIAGPLMAFKDRLFGVLQTIETIIQRNPEMVVTFAKIVAAIATVGAGFVALGMAVKFIGGIFAAASAIVGAFAGVLGFILTPFGAVITAAAALGTYLLWSTGAGGKALDWLGERFAALGTFAVASFQGIKDALVAGDFALAAKILWLSIQNVWLAGINILKGWWLDFKGWFLQKTSDIFYGTVAVVANAWFGLKQIWVTTINFWADVLTKFAVSS